jgi:hypothetical protein
MSPEDQARVLVRDVSHGGHPDRHERQAHSDAEREEPGQQVGGIRGVVRDAAQQQCAHGGEGEAGGQQRTRAGLREQAGGDVRTGQDDERQGEERETGLDTDASSTRCR